MLGGCEFTASLARMNVRVGGLCGAMNEYHSGGRGGVVGVALLLEDTGTA